VSSSAAQALHRARLEQLGDRAIVTAQLDEAVDRIAEDAVAHVRCRI
jgi:hypothetical protein